MNLNKLDIMLCFAFQESEGPFKICIQYKNKKEWSQYFREDIKILSDSDNVINITIVSPKSERRSSLSLYMRKDFKDRRLDKRFK